MSRKHQLAAIMFTDIEGYTALMQADESQAVYLREEHRRIFISTTEKYGGKILQYYGDGTLSIFDSSIAAVNCGIEMQLAFQKVSSLNAKEIVIPVRMGIHSGDVIYSEEEIIGDSVNVASRIESLATVGSVFISDKVYDEIKNQGSILTQSMGLFQLKNVAKPVEVFAIANAGLIIPDSASIQGKAKKIQNKGGSFKTFWNRMQPQLLAGYFVGVWGIIQFTDWILNRYQISSHWIDVLLVFFLSMAPSLMIYLWNRDRIGRGKIKLWEKLIVPGNLGASLLLLFILFQKTDLGATTKLVAFSNDFGVEEFKTIIKPGFRKKLAIYNFTPKKKDSVNEWMGWGIHAGIAEDMSQNGYLTLGFRHKTKTLQEMLKLANKDFYPYLLTGSYEVNGDSYKITSKLYKTQNGALQKTHTYSSKDFFSLIDTISKVTKKDLGFTRNQIDQFVDLPFDHAFTSSTEAYKNYSLFSWKSNLKYLERAITLDSTFARANHIKAAFLYSRSYSVLGAKEAIDQGMRFRQRLPENFEIGLRLSYFQINNQVDKAIALLKMQLEMSPGNQNIMHTLTNYLHFSERYDELLVWKKKITSLDPNPITQGELAEALLLNGQFQEAGKTFKKIYNQYPNQPNTIGALAIYYTLMGNIDKAEPLLEKYLIQDPEIEPLSKEYLKVLQYANNNKPTPESLLKYKGNYRLQVRDAEFDIKNIKNLLYVKGRTQMSGSFFVPSGPDEFMIISENILERWKFIKDSLGRVYKIENQFMDRNLQIYNNILWRQDSLIRKAKGLFSLDKRVEALEAFKAAYHKNPDHFYLDEYIRHLEFVLNPNNRIHLENIKNYMGRYGPRNLWMEDDKIYYARDGEVSKQRLLPISPDSFYFWGGYEYYMQVVVENGQVKGTASWKYDEEGDEFIRDDKDYIAYDGSKLR